MFYIDYSLRVFYRLLDLSNLNFKFTYLDKGFLCLITRL